MLIFIEVHLFPIHQYITVHVSDLPAKISILLQNVEAGIPSYSHNSHIIIA